MRKLAFIVFILCVGMMWAIRTPQNEGKNEKKQTEFEGYMEKAKQGDSYAQWKVSEMYSDGEGVEKNDTAAIEWMKKSVDQKNPFALVRLSMLFSNGQNEVKTAQLMKEAETLFQPLIEKNDPEAMLYLWLARNHNKFDDYADDIDCTLLTRAADMGNMLAMQVYAGAAASDRLKGLDLNKAFGYIEKMEKSDESDDIEDFSYVKVVLLEKLGRHEEAMLIADSLDSNEYVDTVCTYDDDDEEGIDTCAIDTVIADDYDIDYFNSPSNKYLYSIAEEDAKSGNAEGYYGLACCYLAGTGIEPDIPKAIAYLKKADSMGLKEATEKLADIYASEDYGSHNSQEAIRLLMTLYKPGDGNTAVKIASAYMSDDISDYDNTKKWLETAYNDFKDKEKKTACGYGIAMLNSDKENPNPDFDEAVKWLQSTYQLVEGEGDKGELDEAMGNIYSDERNENADYNTALQYYLAAQDEGKTVMVDVVNCYQKLGMNADAVKYLENIGAQGNVDAYNTLAYLYANGNGVAKDKKKALEAIDKGLELCQDDEWNKTNLIDSKGEILYMFGDKKGAKKCYDQIMKENDWFYDENETELWKIFNK